MYVTPHEAAKFYGVSLKTLQRWSQSKKIKFKLTSGGHKRYFCENPDEVEERTSFIYARVSSKKQEKDLLRQIESLQKRYPKHQVIKDIGSGLNFKRKGFLRILEKLFSGSLKEVVVAHQDRFCRFNFDFFKWLFKQFHSKLYSFNDESSKTKSREQEFSDDIIAIITHYTTKYYGRRKYDFLQKD